MKAASSIPNGHHGKLYYDVMQDISLKRSTVNYLEIGVSTGLLLQHIHTRNAYCVDPSYNIDQNFMTHKHKAVLFQMTSDAFFRDASALSCIDGVIDLAFLDGMHTFEFLLRDFYNTEAICGPHSLIAMHDCLPLNIEMTHRNMAVSLAMGQNSAFPDFWTGDVWKIIPLLKKYRPDLNLVFVDAPPTGIVFATNLDSNSKVLPNKYLDIINEFSQLDNSYDNLDDMFEGVNIISSDLLMKDFDHSVFFSGVVLVDARLDLQMNDEAAMRVGHILVCHSIDPGRLFESISVRDGNKWYVFFHGTNQDLSTRIKEMVASRHGRYFPYFENRGLSRSWNEGLFHAQEDRCDAFMIVNDDMFFYDGCHDKFVELAKTKIAQDANLGFVYATGLEGPQSPLAGQIISQGLACSVLTPAVISKIGYFDEIFWPAYWEDMDYTRRAAIAGVSHHTSEDCLVEHDRGSTMRTSPGVMGDSNVHFATNQKRFMEKWGDDNSYDHPYNDPTATVFMGRKHQSTS